LHGPADWISPGFDDEDMPGNGRWYTSPPANDARKVVISDTDHYAAGKGDALWAWKSFLRGHNPILMDFGLIDGMHPQDPSAGGAGYEAFEAVRYAMGDTRRLAEQIALIDMEPREDLSSTGYALADPGREYLVLEPHGTTEPFTITLAAGSYTVQWYDVDSRETVTAAEVTVDSSSATKFSSPIGAASPAVVHARRVGPG
jgi:hypothetical protein